MNMRVSVQEFEATTARCLKQVETTGTPIIVTDEGRAVIVIRRCMAEAASPLERLLGRVLRADEPVWAEEEGSWEASL